LPDKTPEQMDDEARLEFILGHETKEAAPPENPDEPSPQEIEAAIGKLDSAEAVEAEAGKGGAEETQPPAQENQGQTEPAKPALEPPKFWNAEAREKIWPTLSPDVQQAILHPEQEAEKARSRSITEAAELRKQAEQAAAAAAAEQQRVIADRQKATTELALWVQRMMASDPIIADGQRTDWAQAWKTDPAQAGVKQAEYNARLQQWQAQYQALQGEMQQAFQAQAQQTNQARQAFLAKQNELLYERVPEWKEPEKGRAEFKQVVDYARESYGVTPEEIHNLGDHRLVVLLRSDMMKSQRIANLEKEIASLKSAQENARQAIQQKKATPAPRTAAPKAASEEAQDQPTKTARDLRNRALRTGKDSDRIDAVLARLN
jgi:hypothetical protein